MPILEELMEDGHKWGKYEQVPGKKVWIPSEYFDLKERLHHRIEEFIESQEDLYFSADQHSASFKQWIEPAITLDIYRGENLPRWNVSYSIWDASTEFWRHAEEMIQRKDVLELYKYEQCDTDFYWRFIFDNFPYIYGDAFDEATGDYTKENTNRIMSLLEIAWTILGATSGVVLLVGFFFIRPSVNMVFREVDLATAALLAVPKVSIEGFYSTIREIMNIKDKKKKNKKTGQDGKESIAESTESSQKDAASSSADEEGEDSSDDDMLLVDDSNEAGTSSRRALFWKNTARYIVALLLIVIMFTIITTVTYTNCLLLIDRGIRTDLGLRIRFKLYRVGYDVHYLVVDDQKTYPDINWVKKQLAYDTKKFRQIQQAILNGDPEFGIPHERLPEELKDIMFEKHFMHHTESLNQMENTVFQSVNNIMVQSVPLAANQTDVDLIEHRFPELYDGYLEAEHIEEELLTEELAYLSMISQVMFAAAVLGLFSIYAGIFRGLLSGLRDEHEKAKRLLYQIPLDSVKVNYPLQVLLRGKAAANEMFMQHEIPGVRITKDGIPIAADSVINLKYVRATVLASSDSLASRAFSIMRAKITGQKEEDAEGSDQNLLSKKSQNYVVDADKVHEKEVKLSMDPEVVNMDQIKSTASIGTDEVRSIPEITPERPHARIVEPEPESSDVDESVTPHDGSRRASNAGILKSHNSNDKSPSRHASVNFQ
jgi:hypothetical protein